MEVKRVHALRRHEGLRLGDTGFKFGQGNGHCTCCHIGQGCQRLFR